MDEVSEYIKKSRERNISDEDIQNQLLKSGWQVEDIQKAFSLNDGPKLPLPPAPPPQKPSSLKSDFGIWIAFAHILLFISLYSTVISLGALLHQFVNIWIPSGMEIIYSLPEFREYAIKISLATLIVSWPIFSALFLYINKKTLDNPDIKNIKSRKLLVYLTLIVTFIIVLTNLIGTVFTFLNGAVTANFLAHLLVTVGLSGVIFIYLINQVKHDRK